MRLSKNVIVIVIEWNVNVKLCLTVIIHGLENI